jgi:outer membrane protein assembly factor BamB
VWEASLDPSELGSVIPEIPVSLLAYGGDTAVIDQRVIVGVASIGNALAPGDDTFRGSVVAFERFTGAELWRLYTTDDQASPLPEFGAGGGVWSSPAIDRKRKLLFIGTGQAYECPPQFTECPPSQFQTRHTRGALTDSLLAIDYRTGELIWHKQFTQDDVWGANTGLVGRDFDVGAHPNLFSVLARLPGDAGPRRHDLVGVGDKSGHYYILKRDRDQGRAFEDVQLLATLELDPGGSLGAILSTAAYDAGVLYIASQAKVVEGRREAAEIFDILSLPAPPAADFSTKIVAIDVRKLLEGNPADEYTLWSLEEDPDELEGLAQIPGLTTAPLTIANGVLYHASSSGYFRGLDAATGVEIFRRTPLEFERADLGGIVAVPILAGVTIVDGQVFVAAGTSQFALADDQPALLSPMVCPREFDRITWLGVPTAEDLHHRSSSMTGSAANLHRSGPLPLDQHPRPGADRQRVRLHVQHDPAGELLVHRLLGVARQADGVGALDEVGGRIVLAEQPRHADREEVRLVCVSEVDGADPAAILLEHDAGYSNEPCVGARRQSCPLCADFTGSGGRGPRTLSGLVARPAAWRGRSP